MPVLPATFRVDVLHGDKNTSIDLSHGETFTFPNTFRVIHMNILRAVGSIYPEVRQTRVLDGSRRSWTCGEMMPSSGGVLSASLWPIVVAKPEATIPLVAGLRS